MASLVVVLGVVVTAAACADRERAVQATRAQSATGAGPGSSDQAVAGVWPFVSMQEADAYAAGKDETYWDPVRTAREFSVRYVGMKEPAVFPFRDSGSGVGEVGVGPRFGEDGRPLDRPEPTTFVEVRQLSSTPGSAWTVTGARTSGIVAESPRPLDSIASPVALVGRADVFKGRVGAEVREHGMTADRSLGRRLLTVSRGPEGRPGPFRGRVTFAPPSRTGGAVVLSERSAVEGQGIRTAAVVPIRFDTRSSPAEGDASKAGTAKAPATKASSAGSGSARPAPNTTPEAPPASGPTADPGGDDQACAGEGGWLVDPSAG